MSVGEDAEVTGGGGGGEKGVKFLALELDRDLAGCVGGYLV